ncbi:MAG: hypothetical protein HGA97_04710 [Chlorobiaceae bacterium]|jgi:hypothetical protein|nr:hypothetical protein [Chlorobiaceae bacterium]
MKILGFQCFRSPLHGDDKKAFFAFYPEMTILGIRNGRRRQTAKMPMNAAAGDVVLPGCAEILVKLFF